MADNANDDRKQEVSLEDIDARARAEGTTRAKIQQQIASGEQGSQDVTGASQQPDAPTGQGVSNEQTFDQVQSGQQQDGYRDTQGTGYGQAQNTVGQSADDNAAQNDYDPTHSGVRHAQNQPGTRPPTPGRETGTSWGEDQQMGSATDTPDRKNPAG
ncbi:MAG: hypothetical protein M3Y39_15440 [Chloroflexota bacterium]|nr:hypothetical protein [Chloroflexota bacterium]